MIKDQEHIWLLKKGVSLNKINRVTGIGKSTLYYHYRKLNGKLTQPVIIPKLVNEDLGEFVGIFAGDGGYFFDKKTYHHSIRIYTGLYEKEYAKFLKWFMTRLFSKEPRQYFLEKSGVVVTELYSRETYDLIRKYLEWDDVKVKTVRLKDFDSLSKDFLRGFLRGLFDTDGGICRKKNKVAIGTASKKLANQVREIFRKFEIEPGFYKYKSKDFWYIDLYGSRTDKFMKIISTHHYNKLIERL
jgi:intein/homing endonuclease